MLSTCLVQLFGCDFTSLWQTANQKRCHALLRAGRLVEVFEAYQYMANMSDETTKASCLDWSIGKSSVIAPPGFNIHLISLRFHSRVERIPAQCVQRGCYTKYVQV